MKANELQIGDWVQSKANDGKTLYTQIVALDNRDGEKHIISSNRWVEDYKFEPVPLTPEILEKNGWINKASKGWMQKGNFGDGPLMLWYITDTGVFNKHFANELELSDLSSDEGFILKVQCRYVHTLQHALSLCGLNELANNLKL